MSPIDAGGRGTDPEAGGLDGNGGMGSTGRPGATGRRRAWGPVAFAAAGSLLLHGLAVLWVWHFWEGFGRGGMLAWIDFPSSLAYLRLRGGAKLAFSLAVGGLQWAILGAGLSLLFGTSARPPAD
ncbi:MAG TPA: hypothetical protein VMW75_03615 [Thermoanaerobaculia bacterium]|nr:hypothetical protein [Thermoanaerobaculia bacterium]